MSPAPTLSNAAPAKRENLPLAFGLIFAATTLAYLPALRAGFVWDDNSHVTRPALRSLRGLGRIWAEPGATLQYYPVLHSAFWLEHRIWGDSAFGYHLLNVFLHAASACLLALIMRRLRMGGAWIAAAIFALHPVCVESVAWISEQKNTLSTVFYLAATLSYLRWSEPPSRRPLGGYLLAGFFFVLALLSKTVTATLPAALLVVLWWRRPKPERLSWRRDAIPLLPWFAAGAAAGLFSAWAERRFVGAEGSAFSLTLVQRFLVAGRAVCFYLGKLLWSADLAFIYPRWTVSSAEGWQYLFPLGVLSVLAAFWLIRRRTRAPLAGMLVFAGSLFPTLGFFNVYAFIFSYVADHWQYLASFGVIVPLSAGAALALERASPRGRKAGQAAVAAIVAILGILTWRQCGEYRDIESFFRAILARNPAAWMADDNLGVILEHTGRLPEAIAHFEKAVRLNPDFAKTYNDYGSALAKEGRLPEAIAACERALQLAPDYGDAHNNLGNVLASSGRLPEAIPHFEKAIAWNPDNAEAHANLGLALAMDGRLDEGIDQLSQALRLNPDFAAAHYNLAMALRAAGRYDEAAVQLDETRRLRSPRP